MACENSGLILRLKPDELRLRRRKEKGAKFISSDQPWFQLRLGKRVTRLHARLWRGRRNRSDQAFAKSPARQARLPLQRTSNSENFPEPAPNLEVSMHSKQAARLKSLDAFATNSLSR